MTKHHLKHVPHLGLPKQPQPRKTKQRVNWFVPSPRVLMQMGVPLLSTDQTYSHGAFGFPGFSLQADNNLYLRVGKPPEGGKEVGSGQTVLDSHGAVVMQTRNTWQQWAAHDIILSAGQAFAALAKHPILIYSGELSEAPVDHPISGEELQHNKLADAEFNEFVAQLQEMDATFGRVVTSVDLAKALLGGLIAIPTGYENAIAQVATKLLTLGEWTKGAITTAGSFVSREPPENPSIIAIHGKSGVTLTSPKEIELAAKGEAKIFGNLGVKIAAATACSMEAGIEAKTFGGIAACLGSGALTEVTSFHSVEIGARRGSVEVKAGQIALGNAEVEPGKHAATFNKLVAAHAALGGGAKLVSKIAPHANKVQVKQVPTTRIAAEANEEIKLESKNKLALVADGEDAKKQPQGQIEIKAKKKIEIEVDESAGEIRMTLGSFSLKITEHTAELGKGASKGSNPTDAYLKIDDKGVVTLASGADNAVEIKGGSNGSLNLKSSDLQFLGRNVKVTSKNFIKLG